MRQESRGQPLFKPPLYNATLLPLISGDRYQWGWSIENGYGATSCLYIAIYVGNLRIKKAICMATDLM
jgi:hypothetical protein